MFKNFIDSVQIQVAEMENKLSMYWRIWSVSILIFCRLFIFIEISSARKESENGYEYTRIKKDKYLPRKYSAQ